MNLGQVLKEAREDLERSKIDDAALEAEVLLRHTLGIDRAGLFSSLKAPIEAKRYAAFRKSLERRLAGEPAAYITGHREFFRLDFLVDRRVLIPRPETELLVETAIEWCRKYDYRTAADIGTGSGIIAVSLAAHLPEIDIIATDVSEEALQVALENSRRHGVEDRISFHQGDLLTALPGPVDLICANPPYVPRGELPSGGPLAYEPYIALDGGPEGTDVLVRFCRSVPLYLQPGGGLLMELGIGQVETVRAALGVALPAAAIDVLKDLAGIERLVTVRLTGFSGKC